ncbi:hypothetical protein [Gordonia sputi]
MNAHVIRRGIKGIAAIAAVVLVVLIVLYFAGVFRPTNPATSSPEATSSQAPTAIAPGSDDVTTSSPPQSPSTSSPPRFPAPFAAIDPTNPIAVMSAGLTTIFSYQPTDDTQLDAAHRATPLLGPAGVDPGFAALAPITGRQWATWKSRRETVRASASIPTRNDNPDTPTAVSRIALITQTVYGPNGSPEGLPPAPLSVYTAVTKDNTGSWHITKITVEQ